MNVYERYNIQHGKSNKMLSKSTEFESIDNYIDTIVKRRKEIEILDIPDDFINDVADTFVKEIYKAIST